MSLRIEEMRERDWPEVRAIYLEGIATGLATFETEAPSWERWNAGHLACCRLVAREDDRIRGWAALSPVSTRRVYAGVAEVSVYVGERERGAGVGRALLKSLVTASEESGLWTLQASVFAENHASIALHISCGFRIVGARHRIARLQERWHDTILLERRSSVVGVD